MNDAARRFPRYGEVWTVDLEPVVGAEIGKRRPALIVSNDQNNRHAGTVTILPITSTPPRRDYLDEVVVPAGVAGLSRQSRIKANMVRTLDKSRVLRLVGSLPEDYFPLFDRRGPADSSEDVSLNSSRAPRRRRCFLWHVPDRSPVELNSTAANRAGGRVDLRVQAVYM